MEYSEKTLIVDDDKISRYVAQSIMKKYGAVEQAASGLEAITKFEEAFESSPFTIVVLDIMMPQMDGQQVMKRLREIEFNHGVSKEKRTKIIMLSAIEDKRTILSSYQGGCEAYLRKPIVAKALDDAVLQVLSNNDKQ